MSFLVIPLRPYGQINVKLNRNSLFSERYSRVPTVSIFGIRFTWRAYR